MQAARSNYFCVRMASVSNVSIFFFKKNKLARCTIFKSSPHFFNNEDSEDALSQSTIYQIRRGKGSVSYVFLCGQSFIFNYFEEICLDFRFDRIILSEACHFIACSTFVTRCSLKKAEAT